MTIPDNVTNLELAHTYSELGMRFVPELTRQQAYEGIIARLIEDPEITTVSKQAIVTLYKLGCVIVDEKATVYQKS